MCVTLITSAFIKVSIDLVIQPAGFFILRHCPAASNIVDSSFPFLLDIFLGYCTVWFCFVLFYFFVFCFSIVFFPHMALLPFSHILHGTVPQDFGLQCQPPSTISTIPISSHLWISLPWCFHQNHKFTMVKVKFFPANCQFLTSLFLLMASPLCNMPSPYPC